jgi:hypothetical protein
VAELAGRTDDRDITLLSDALSLLGPAAPGASPSRATDVHERAGSDGSLLGAWVASTVASAQAATAEDAIRWCDRQAELQVLLGRRYRPEARPGLSSAVTTGPGREVATASVAAALTMPRR